MTTLQYLRAIKKLGYTPSGQATAQALGLTVRQCQNIAAGASPVSPTLELLLLMYLTHQRTMRRLLRRLRR